jgi:predicted phosphohydrolase
MKKFQFQLFSDIHLELRNSISFDKSPGSFIPKIRPLCPTLFLAGDIGNATNPSHLQFLDYCSQNWAQVYYVPGNHEFYVPESNFENINRTYKHTIGERYTNVHYLDNEAVPLTDDINLYGCTFWTRPSVSDKYSYFTDHMYVDISEVARISMEHEQALKTYLKNTTKKTIVMTHFPPVQNQTSHPRFVHQPQENTDYFAWNASTLGEVAWHNVIGWISGHTHHSYDFIDKGGVRFLSNQMGYRNELTDSSNTFNEDGLFEFDVKTT